MEWYVYLAYFFAGALLANGVPHFVEGIAGRRFQSPFASPPGVGESPPPVNVIWGLTNIFGGYALIAGVGDFEFGLTRDVLMISIGAFLAAIALAVYFGRLRSR
ncbi:MAG: hypothetical protein JSW38_13055 [Dehalococcoidia bacterium]|nr:MAG: hypothetical protein JSW38_13055 [Dehalococcoidia bacterium]